MLLAEFNATDRASATAVLSLCIGVPRWVEELADGRPYADRASLLAHAATAAEPFGADEVAAALDRHPRIGERATGPATEAALSRQEQSGIATADAELAESIRRGNLAYEVRFGRVFLIRAAGRSAGEILGQLTARLGNTPDQEDLIVAQQLREIALLRLAGLIGDGGMEEGGNAP